MTCQRFQNAKVNTFYGFLPQRRWPTFYIHYYHQRGKVEFLTAEHLCRHWIHHTKLRYPFKLEHIIFGPCCCIYQVIKSCAKVILEPGNTQSLRMWINDNRKSLIRNLYLSWRTKTAFQININNTNWPNSNFRISLPLRLTSSVI